MDRQFESAVNLGLDLNKFNKLQEYIPTDASVSLLKEYLKGIDEETDEKSTVLIGPYGKGKSHLVLILCALAGMPLDKQENREALNKLIGNIRMQDPEAADIATRLIERNKRLLPVIINGGYGDLQQTFLVALKEALEREGINDITPNTYYDVAIRTINKWKSHYEETYHLFEEKLQERKHTCDEFIGLLNNYDRKAYNLFCRIHMQVCAGTIFNPMINMDTVSIYKSVNDELHQHGYSGILVVFDEFSKFLDNTKLHSPGELKVLQDFAEFTNRKENQVYLICITHKPIGNYAKDLPKERAMAYRTVEGRFKEVYFVSSAEQNYELIKNSIQRNEQLYKRYLDENRSFFNDLKDKTAATGIFPQGKEALNNIVEGCFPLHPMTTFMSIRISELVAQNERTLFTFLASHQKYTLRAFIESNKNKNATLTMDRLYDYFKDGIKKELSNDTIASVFMQTENLLRQKLSKVQAKIIKCMALINMINQPNVIQATDKVLKVAVNEDDDTFEQEKNSLIRSHYIYQRKSDGVFICLNTSAVNVDNKIQECKQLKVRNIDRKSVLTEVIDLGYTLPKAFNDKYEMIRYFKNCFVPFKELEVMNSVEDYLLQQHCDGIIGYLLYDEQDDLKSIRDKVKELNDPRLVLFIPGKPFSLDESLKEYVAISVLKEDKNFVEHDDPVLDELLLHEHDILELITQRLNNYLALDNEDGQWVCSMKEIVQPLNKKKLSSMISKICETVYCRTPIIASELINKHNISGPILAARNKIIGNILEGNELATKGNSPDITITRATITNKKVLEEDVEDNGLKNILKEIETFILSSDGMMQNFGELYEKLYRAPYGMRKGIIPIYLAIYLKKYSNNVVLYNQLKEEDLSVDTIKLIDKQPSNYNLLLEKGTSERVEYIRLLADIFELKVDGMPFYQQCKLIVDKMKNWFRSLPKCSRELQSGKIEGTCIIEFRKHIVKFDINAREFLFETIPQVICKDEDLYQCAHMLKKVKSICEQNFEDLVLDLIKYLKKLFAPQYSGGLGGALKTWYLGLDNAIDQYVLSTQASKLINLVKSLDNYNEKDIVSQMGYIFTGLQIEDWNQNTISIFNEEANNIIEEINASAANNYSVENNDEIRISIDKGGRFTQKLIRDNEISALGETLMTNLADTLDEYGEAIDTTEKMNILIKLIQGLM